MTTVKIGGKEYALGDVPFTDENLDLFEAAMEGEVPKGFLKSIRRMLHDSLADANGEEVAAEAMSKLKMSFRPDGELMLAFQGIVERMSGK